MAFKMNARSPLMKTLVGAQKNLPEGLKNAIEAAPESPAKNMNKGYGTPSPAKMNKGERYDMKMASDQNLKASARKNYAENAEAAQKSSPAKAGVLEAAKATLAQGGMPSIAAASAVGAIRQKKDRDNSIANSKTHNPRYLTTDARVIPSKDANRTSRVMGPPEAPKAKAPEAKAKPKYDKQLNTLVSLRKGLKKGTAEYNTIQNKINAKLGSKKVHGRGTGSGVGELASKSKKIDAPKLVGVNTSKAKADKVVSKDIAKAKPEVKASKAKGDSMRVTETPGRTKMVTKTGGGANKGGTTKKETVTRNKKKVVIKDGDTRTVIKRDNKGARITDTKTTKRVGAKIKGAIKDARLARLDRVAKRQAAKAKGSGKKPGSKTEQFG
jgi:hypothetical protein